MTRKWIATYCRRLETFAVSTIKRESQTVSEYGLSNAAGIKNMVVARLHSYFHTNEGAPQAAENTEPTPITLLTTANTVKMNTTDS